MAFADRLAWHSAAVGNDEKIPANPGRKKLLDCERKPFSTPVLAEGKVGDLATDVMKVGEKLSRLGFTEGVGVGTFRAIGAMVDEVGGPQIAPAPSQKIGVMQVPEPAALIPSTHAPLPSVGLPTPETGKHLQQEAQAHVNHDPDIIIKTVFVVEHDDGLAAGL